MSLLKALRPFTRSRLAAFAVSCHAPRHQIGSHGFSAKVKKFELSCHKPTSADVIMSSVSPPFLRSLSANALVDPVLCFSSCKDRSRPANFETPDKE